MLNEIGKGRGITTMHSISLQITVKIVKNTEKRHNRNHINSHVWNLDGILRFSETLLLGRSNPSLSYFLPRRKNMYLYTYIIHTRRTDRL